MFGRKNKIRPKEMREVLQDGIDMLLKIEDPAGRYEALEGMAIAVTEQKDAHDKMPVKQGKKLLGSASLVFASMPASIGAMAFLKPLVVADLVMTGGILTGGALLVTAGYLHTSATSEVLNKYMTSAEYKGVIDKIRKHQLAILENTDPQQLLSSQNAKKQLLENPAIRNKFLAAAQRKQLEELLNQPSSPPVKKKNPGFEI